jgi:hypothetical protein
MFSFWKNPVEKCTRYFPRCNVNRGKVTSWRILVWPPAAPSIIRFLIAGSSLPWYNTLEDGITGPKWRITAAREWRWLERTERERVKHANAKRPSVTKAVTQEHPPNIPLCYATTDGTSGWRVLRFRSRSQRLLSNTLSPTCPLRKRVIFFKSLVVAERAHICNP